MDSTTSQEFPRPEEGEERGPLGPGRQALDPDGDDRERDLRTPEGEDREDGPPAADSDDEARRPERPDSVPRGESTPYLALPPDLRRQWSRRRRWYRRPVVRALLAIVGLAALAAAWWFLIRGGT